MKDEGNNNQGDEKTAGRRDKEERVSNLRCLAQHVRHSADSSKFEHKMLTDQKKLRIDQDTFRNLNITMASLFNIKCYVLDNLISNLLN